MLTGLYLASHWLSSRIIVWRIQDKNHVSFLFICWHTNRLQRGNQFTIKDKEEYQKYVGTLRASMSAPWAGNCCTIKNTTLLTAPSQRWQAPTGFSTCCNLTQNLVFHFWGFLRKSLQLKTYTYLKRQKIQEYPWLKPGTSLHSYHLLWCDIHLSGLLQHTSIRLLTWALRTR